MKNEQKYKMPDERVKAFGEWCLQNQGKQSCAICIGEKDMRFSKTECFANWLADEAEVEKPENCPFCGGETHINLGHLKAGVVHYWVDCISPDCMYRSAHYTDEAEAIAAHNRVCRAVDAAKKGDVK